MTQDQLIAKWLPALSGLADFFESLKAQHPDLATQLDPKIAVLRATADPVILSNAVGAGLAELQRLLETGTLDPRFKPSDLA